MAVSEALQRAIGAWHDGLTPELAAESEDWLTEQLRRRGLFFGARPLCTVLRPRFLTPEQYALLRARIVILLGAFERALHAALADPRVLDQFGLLDWERTLALEDPRIPASPVSRLDAFFGEEGLRFTEYNAETPAGSAYHDALSELFLALPAARPFLRTHALCPLPARPNVLHALLGAYAQWSGRREPPVIGILDWKEVPTWSEFVLYQEYFTAMGLRCVIADVRECELVRGKLVAAGTPIDLIYKRVLIGELIAREGLVHPIVRAVRSGAVCMVNPFRCKILHKKASLAVLTDERNAEWFNAAQRKVIADQIPWTRVVEERKTEFHGERIDLLPWLARNRERLVLKPNDDYGGAGIVLGWEVAEARWQEALQHALSEPFIVQERIGLPEESFPSYVDGELIFANRILDTAPFVFGGAYADGCLTRVSTASLVNVTAGGGSTVPTFVVEKR
ncbi:MAG TPA: hypothetical protein VGQ73_05135 [Gemmatimonadales bacterium]|jgi:hypothetical protein|nr:hypothetical protein [Gemmatimonadales bacterium]